MPSLLGDRLVELGHLLLMFEQNLDVALGRCDQLLDGGAGDADDASHDGEDTSDRDRRLVRHVRDEEHGRRGDRRNHQEHHDDVGLEHAHSPVVVEWGMRPTRLRLMPAAGPVSSAVWC